MARKVRYLATPPQRLTGKNTYNNRVVVDYDEKRVHFDPMIINKASRNLYLMIVNLGMCILILMGVFVYLPLVVYYDLTYIETPLLLNLVLFFVCSLTAMFICGIYVLIYTFSEYFREWVFPRFNHLIIKILRGPRSKKQKAFIVSENNIINNQVLIPRFNNVALEWTTWGSYSDYLQKVEIKNLFINSDSDWYALFTFKKRPRGGAMTITYT